MLFYLLILVIKYHIFSIAFLPLMLVDQSTYLNKVDVVILIVMLMNTCAIDEIRFDFLTNVEAEIGDL